MDITHKNLFDEATFTANGIVTKVLAETDSAKHVLFCMKADTEISEHTSTKETVVTVIKGKGIFMLEGEEIKMVPGIFIPMEPNAKHAISAEEDLIFVLGLTG